MPKEERYPGVGLKNTQHGVIFQVKLLMLFLHRARELCENKKYGEFRLATEMTEAEKFDDVVFQYKDDDDKGGKWKFRLLQAKHRKGINPEDELNKIKVTDLLSTNDENDFSLQKYFRSFIKIKRNIQEGSVYSAFSHSELEDVILCTNTDFIDGLKNSLREENIDKDDLLKVNKINNEKWQKASMYKFNQENILSKKLAVIFTTNSDFYRLIEEIVEIILNEKQIEKKGLFKDYYYSLTNVVFDIRKKKGNDDTYLCFREDFIIGKLDENEKRFRDELVKELMFRQHYEDKKLKLSEDFCKIELPDEEEKLKELAKNLADFAVTKRELTISHFEDYHIALIAQVINANTKKLYRYEKLKKEKNALKLRNFICEEMKVTIGELMCIEFGLSEDFGKCPLLSDDENELNELAEQLASHIKRDEELEVENSKYHVSLSKEAIDVQNRKFKESFVNGKKLKDKKNIDIDPPVKIFRRLLLNKIFDDIEGTAIGNSLKARRINISQGFVKEFKPEANPQIVNPREFAEQMKCLFRDHSEINDQENYTKIMVREEIFDGTFKANFRKLAGHVLIEKYGKIRFSTRFLNSKTMLKGNLNEFKREFERMLENEVESLYEYAFDIEDKKFKTCEEGLLERKLPVLHGDNDIEEFFRKLKFVVNYPNRKEVIDLIAGELKENIRALDSEDPEALYQKTLLDWLANRMSTFLTLDKARKLFSIIKRKFLFWEFKGINDSYFGNIPEGFEFKKYVGIVDFLDNAQQQVLNIKSQNLELSRIRISQTLQMLEQREDRDNLKQYTGQFGKIFLNLKRLKNSSNNVLECFDDPNKGNLLVLYCSSSVELEIVQELLNRIASIVKLNAKKKVILLTIGDNRLTAYFGTNLVPEKYAELNDDATGFQDLDLQSQQNVLDEKVITFQGQKKKLSLGDLFGIEKLDNASAEELYNVITPESLVWVISKKKITIGSKSLQFSDSEAAHTDIYEVIPESTLASNLSESSQKSTLFMISGISDINNSNMDLINDKFIKLFKADLEKQVRAITNKTCLMHDGNGDKNIVIITTIDEDQKEESFKQLCETNPTKTI